MWEVVLRFIGILSVVCLTLLLSNATSGVLICSDLSPLNGFNGLKELNGKLTVSFEAKRHEKPLHTRSSRYLYKPAERQNLSMPFLPVNDSIYANSNRRSSLYYRESESDTDSRIKRHHESNLIYRFIHSRNTSVLASV